RRAGGIDAGQQRGAALQHVGTCLLHALTGLPNIQVLLQRGVDEPNEGLVGEELIPRQVADAGAIVGRGVAVGAGQRRGGGVGA
nr:hypothetical protein [Tanacetum cinerariifolium]